ncbi:oligopeptide ABC transporter permease [Aeribacillus pallidus]|jgi:oligopeptide transport system permease protein|uniref:oligopeptide ABC transporter permease n=1 Tax=Aeribacillus pallidus TaxID=33936 RepID=UPI003D263DFD
MKATEERIPKELFEPAQINQLNNEKIAKPSLNFWQDSWLRVRKNKGAIIALVVLIFLTFMAFVGPYMNDYTFDEQNLAHANLPPRVPVLENFGILDGTSERNGQTFNMYELKGIEDYYWFGTDSLGRDIFTRLWKGTQVSLYIAVVATLIDVFIGVAYGGISAYYGGRVDNIMQRILEILAGIPNLVIVILMILVLEPGITSIILALALTGWIGMARVVRGQVLKLKNQEFVLASKTLGASDAKIIFKHLIPNLAGIIIINTMFTIPSAIFFEAFLSFIGLGLQPPLASLGTLIDDGYKTMQFLPHALFFPALVLSLLLIAFNLLADGLRDAFDPKMRD